MGGPASVVLRALVTALVGAAIVPSPGLADDPQPIGRLEPLPALSAAEVGPYQLVQLDPLTLAARPGGITLPGVWLPLAVSPDERRAALLDLDDGLRIVGLNPPRDARAIPLPPSTRRVLAEPETLTGMWPQADRIVVLLARVTHGRPGRLPAIQPTVAVVDPDAGRVVARRPLPATSELTVVRFPGHLAVERRRGRVVSWDVIGASGRVEHRIELGPLPPGYLANIAVQPGASRVLVVPPAGALLDVDLVAGTVEARPRPDLAPPPGVGAVPIPATAAWLDAQRIVLTGVAARDGIYGSGTVVTGAWVVDASTWRATVLPVRASAASSVATGGAWLAGYTRYRPRAGRPAVAGSTGTGLAVVGSDGRVRWRTDAGRRTVEALDGANGRLYVAPSSQVGGGPVLDAATGALLGRWAIPGGLDAVTLLRHARVQIVVVGAAGAGR